MFFFLGTEERVRNSHGKRAINIRAIEVLLYVLIILNTVNILHFKWNVISGQVPML